MKKVLIIIGIICLLEFILVTIFSGYWYFVVATFVILVTIEALMMVGLNKRRGKFSKNHSQQLKKLEDKERVEYSKAMAVYNAQMKDYNMQRSEILEKKKRVYADRIAEAQNTYYAAVEKLNTVERTLDMDMTLGEDEKDIEVVNYLLSRLGSRRADSIKEALQQYDQKVESEKRVAKAEADEKERQTREWKHYEAQLNAQIAEDRIKRREEINAGFAQMKKEIQQKQLISELQDTVNEINSKL